uniref:Uncharacterized protein n=1 Tax=Anguilla anguilla TaxID=7936 RepID=A0A0E9WQM0_ANGAN
MLTKQGVEETRITPVCSCKFHCNPQCLTFLFLFCTSFESCQGSSRATGLPDLNLHFSLFIQPHISVGFVCVCVCILNVNLQFPSIV